MGGSSSQRRTNSAMSPINAFPFEALYSPQFSDTFQENTGYWQEPNPHIAWTIEEEIALAKGWVAISKNSKHGDGASDKDYINREMTHYQVETGLTFKYRHCWEVLKDSPKWKEIALPKLSIEFEGGSKRHKSSGSTSFNAESGDASINLNTNAGDNDEDDVYKIRRIMGRDKARAVGKNKGSKASGSSTMNDDALARLMVTEMTAQEKEQHEAFLEIKRREAKCREREIAAQEYRQQQEDIRFYLQPYDHLTEQMTMDEARAKIKAKYNLQY
ncbi:hypothetical protein Tco_0109606 [Tanacetum coccineum]